MNREKTENCTIEGRNYRSNCPKTDFRVGIFTKKGEKIIYLWAHFRNVLRIIAFVTPNTL